MLYTRHIGLFVPLLVVLGRDRQILGGMCRFWEGYRQILGGRGRFWEGGVDSGRDIGTFWEGGVDSGSEG